MTWHIPSPAELTTVQRLIDRFLISELETLDKFAANEIEIDKDELKTRLNIVNNILHGCGHVLPFWSEDKLNLVESRVRRDPLEMLVHPDQTMTNITYNGNNVRVAVIQTMDRVQNRLLKVNT